MWELSDNGASFLCIPLLILAIYGSGLWVGARFCGRTGFFLIWLLQQTLLFLSVFYLLYQVVIEGLNYHLIFAHLTLPGLVEIEMELIGDPLSVMMLAIVVNISALIQFYSFVYMYAEERQLQFICLLEAFSFFMALFVLSNNLILSFTAWEGLGFISFSLINFWHTREEANKAAVKSILFNRLADIWFVLAIAISAVCLRTLDFELLNATAYTLVCEHVMVDIPGIGEFIVIDVLAVCLYLAAIGKSAQLGYHVWLVAAMEGPTPVSALLHSATMVTAGVYLVLRCHEIFANCSLWIMLGISLYSVLTSIVCGWLAFKAYDLKRIIAFSTCSHLGLMFATFGFNLIEVAELHVHVHAFLKATMFLCAGLVMANFLHLQDFRKLACFAAFSPVCYSLLVFSSTSLCGLPFTIGAFSKERIVVLLYVNSDLMPFYTFRFTAMFLAFIVGVLYTVKLILYSGGLPSFVGDRRVLSFLKGEPLLLWIVPLLLCGSLFLGIYVLSTFVLSEISTLDFWNQNRFIITQTTAGSVPRLYRFFLLITVPIILLLVQVLPMMRRFLIGFYNLKAYLAWLWPDDEEEKPKEESNRTRNLVWTIFLASFFKARFFFVDYFLIGSFAISNFDYYLARMYRGIIAAYLEFSYFLIETWERGFLEIVGPIGLIRLINAHRKTFMAQQRGVFSTYVFRFFRGMFIILYIVCGIVQPWVPLDKFIIFLTVCFLVASVESYYLERHRKKQAENPEANQKEHNQ